MSNISKNKTIELWRFIFIFSICIMHFNESFQIRTFGEVKSAVLGGSFIGVDFFFILSGFLLYKTFYSKEQKSSFILQDAWHYTYHKIKSIYPIFITSFILLFIYNLITTSQYNLKNILFSLYSFKWELLLMSMFEIGDNFYSNYPLWYISVWILVGHIIYSLLKQNKEFFINFIAPLTIVLGYAWYSNTYGTLAIWSDYKVFLLVAWIRGSCGMALGCLMYQLYLFLLKTIISNKKLFLMNMIELFSYIKVITYIGKHPSQEDFFVVLCLCCIIVCSFLNQTLISCFFNNKISSILGSISRYMYFFQVTIHAFILDIIKNIALKKTTLFIVDALCILFFSFLIMSIVNIYNKKKRLRKVN